MVLGGTEMVFLGYGNGVYLIVCDSTSFFYHIAISQVFHIFCQKKAVKITLIHVIFSCFYNSTISHIFFDKKVKIRLINAMPRFMLVY